MVLNFTVQLWLLVFLVLCSAFFSGVEAAFLALTPIEVKRMVEKKLKYANLVKKLKEEPHKFVITVLIGNNLVNISASTIAANLALQVFQSNALAVSTGIMTMVILVFGEITPKTMAIGHRELVARYASGPIRVLGIVLYPLIWILDSFTGFLSRWFKATTDDKVTEEEIKSVVSMGEESGSIEKEEKWMINNILRFSDVEASEIMTPRVDMFFVQPRAKLSDISEAIIRSGRSRIPVIDKDKVVGVIFIKDVFEQIANSKEETKVSAIMRKPYIVPEQKKIDELLREFQHKKMHIAILVDEHGSVSGLVTIEDILEEIVGEIYDEKDQRKFRYRRLDKVTYLVNGGLRIERVNEKVGLGLKVSDEYDTISGFILKKLGRIPQTGDKLEYKNHTFIIEKADDLRIQVIRIIKGE